MARGGFWYNGVMGLAALCAVVTGGALVIYGLGEIIKKNIEWAKKLGGGK